MKKFLIAAALVAPLSFGPAPAKADPTTATILGVAVLFGALGVILSGTEYVKPSPDYMPK